MILEVSSGVPFGISTKPIQFFSRVLVGSGVLSKLFLVVVHRIHHKKSWDSPQQIIFRDFAGIAHRVFPGIPTGNCLELLGVSFWDFSNSCS